jgi:hypothetical protein
VFRLGERELLALILSFGDQPDSEAMAEEAAAIPADSIATLAVRSEQVVLLRSAVPWSQANVVTERRPPAARGARTRADIDALVVALPRGDYAVGRITVGHDHYGYDAWRIVGD